MNRLIETDIIVRTLVGRLVELHGAEAVAGYLEHLWGANWQSRRGRQPVEPAAVAPTTYGVDVGKRLS